MGCYQVLPVDEKWQYGIKIRIGVFSQLDISFPVVRVESKRYNKYRIF